MKRIVFTFVIFLFCALAVAQEPNDWFIFNQKGLQASVVSEDVSMDGLDYAYNSPTAIDGRGNFYYCISKGNPHGYLWIIKKVDKASGKSDEVLRLNLDKYKFGAIRSINFSGDGSLYVWLSLKISGTKGWEAFLVAIKGL